MIICGGMAFTFKKTLENVAVNIISPSIDQSMTSLLSQIGNSLFDQAGSEKVASLVEKAKKNNVKLVLPVDYITGDKFAKDAKVGNATDQQGIPDGCMGLDVGPLSRKSFRSTVLDAKTILWNGQVTHQSLKSQSMH